ncbi:sigma-54-dependent transcriptional regulator [Marinagarivorans algicola]|uniref:sigma-54-dependent transcriptional regulator n=1 Tax=Marinagarivorans algicola TaxID=1513270 RepID=UPI0006B491FD|nr:sigma-54 dependent transcriptional regulator [Marinagarivorans algicola]
MSGSARAHAEPLVGERIAPKVLVVEDDPALREALCDTLVLANFDVMQAHSAEQAISLLPEHLDMALVVSDVNMGALSGHDLLRHIRKEYAHIPVLLITAFASISESVEAMRQGAVDYLVKPFEAEVLTRAARKFVGQSAGSCDEPVAIAPSSQKLLQLARRVAQSDSTALLVGESGTGKEVLARYIHEYSPRKTQPFIAINCAAIPENMLEAMLFGHEKGAYTGAYSSAPGKFEQANGGTLLLDEISEMALPLQAKLLRVLQEREVERLGGRKCIQLDVRVIATTNRDMRQEVVDGKFREDLYFRLSVLPLQWAPLRDRKEDILPLAKSLLQRHAAKQHRAGVYLSDTAKQLLLQYPWPGNVRELDNVMQRALILQAGNVIAAEDLGLQAAQHFSQKPSLVDVMQAELAPSSECAQTLVANTVAAGNGGDDFAPSHASGPVVTQVNVGSVAQPWGGANWGSSPKDIPASLRVQEREPLAPVAELGHDLRQREFEIIRQTLKSERGSKKETAKRLGISARTLRYKMAKLREEGFDLDSL